MSPDICFPVPAERFSSLARIFLNRKNENGYRQNRSTNVHVGRPTSNMMTSDDDKNVLSTFYTIGLDHA